MAGKSFMDKLKEQEWFQQLSQSYQQLPPDQQNYVKWGSMGGGALLLLYFIFSTVGSANQVKNDYFEKQDLARVLNHANDEIRRLKGQNSGISSGGAQNWASILQGLAGNTGLQGNSVEILKESPGATQGTIQETLLEVKVKGATLRPLVQMLYQVEHGSPPMKLKGLVIEPNDADGTMNAKLNLSGYLAKADKSEKSK
jgi:hypothetical protein